MPAPLPVSSYAVSSYAPDEKLTYPKMVINASSARWAAAVATLYCSLRIALLMMTDRSVTQIFAGGTAQVTRAMKSWWTTMMIVAARISDRTAGQATNLRWWTAFMVSLTANS